MDELPPMTSTKMSQAYWELQVAEPAALRIAELLRYGKLVRVIALLLLTTVAAVPFLKLLPAVFLLVPVLCFLYRYNASLEQQYTTCHILLREANKRLTYFRCKHEVQSFPPEAIQKQERALGIIEFRDGVPDLASDVAEIASHVDVAALHQDGLDYIIRAGVPGAVRVAI